MNINGNTKLFCVIGDPIEHTLSPAMHNALFDNLKLNCVYTALRVTPPFLEDFVKGIRTMDLGGVNVTIPHKVAIIDFLDELSEEAQIIGAVNTIEMRGKKLIGHNTDGIGAIEALIQGGADPKNKNVLILGSGGAARAIGVTIALRSDVSSLTVLGIKKDELKQLVDDIKNGTGVKVFSKLMDTGINQELLKDSDIIIHCTPVGMYPNIDQTIITAEEIPSHIKLMDIVYTPLETQLLKEAKKAGVETYISGIDMFVNQGVESAKLWLKIDPPRDIMKQVVLDNLRD